jgi:hypothetical protein
MIAFRYFPIMKLLIIISHNIALLFLCSSLSLSLWIATAQLGPRPPLLEVSISHTIRHARTHAQLLWMSNHLVAKPPAAQHTTNTTHQHPCPQRNSNPVIPAIKRLHSYALDRTAIGVGFFHPVLRTILHFHCFYFYPPLHPSLPPFILLSLFTYFSFQF